MPYPETTGRATGSRPLELAPAAPLQPFRDPVAAVDRLVELFERNTRWLRDAFARLLDDSLPDIRVRAFYPQIRLVTDSHTRVDSRLSYGFVSGPGIHASVSRIFPS